MHQHYQNAHSHNPSLPTSQAGCKWCPDFTGGCLQQASKLLYFQPASSRRPPPQMVYHLLRFDGAARPNPGHSGAGCVIYKVTPNYYYGEDEEEEVFRGSFFLGFNCTNNEAQWMALVKGHEAAVRMGIDVLDVEGDSELVINQMKGVYYTRNSRLQYWRDRARRRPIS